MIKTVSHLLQSGTREVHTIATSASVFDAIALMAEKNVGALPVLDNGQIVGIITERDYARKIALMGRSSRETPVSAIMTSPVLYVRPDQSFDDCLALMCGIRSRHLPVLDGDKLVGLISIGDMVNSMLLDRHSFAQDLEHYIWQMNPEELRQERYMAA